MKRKNFLATLLLVASSVSLYGQLPGETVKGKALPYNTSKTDIVNLKAPAFPPIPSQTFRVGSSTPTLLFDQADGEAKVWGFLGYDMRLRTNAVVNFTTDNPNSYAMVNDYRQELGVSKYITAATFVKDQLYGYACTYYGPGALIPYGVVKINPETGEYTLVKKVDITTGLLLNDMTYDPVTETIYGIQFNEDTQNPTNSFSNIYTIDPETGIVDSVARVDYLLYTIAADVTGDLYGVARDMTLSSNSAQNSFLVKIPAEDIESGDYPASRVGDQKLGYNVYYQQSMEFDRTTHRLWWFAQGQVGNPALVEIDYHSGQVNKSAVREMASSQVQIVALGIPYQQVDAAAPSYPTGLKGKAGAEGASSATLTWTNPTKDYMGNSLDGLDGINIYRDGEKIATLESSATSYSDNSIPAAGYYTYRVEPFNSHGNGVYKEVRFFIGKDRPGKVRNLLATADGTSAHLSWNSPENGKNGGWYDKSSLTYKVVRMPDNVVVSESADSTITDQVDKYAGYTYQITTVNHEGEGETVSSAALQFGPNVAIPYTDSLNTQSGFDEWTVLDANHDGTTWYFDEGNKQTNYFYSLNAANDYLISPPLLLDGSKQYKASYTYWSSNWVRDDANHTPIMEKMRLYYGEEPSVAGLSNKIADLGEFHTSSGNYLYGSTVFAPSYEQGARKGYVAFQACSDADCGIIYLKDVVIREYSSTDVSNKDLNGSATANVGYAYSFGVDVCNEGSAPVSGFTLQILNKETGEVVASRLVDETVGIGETKNLSVEWTPTTQGTFQFTSRIVFDQDTYPADNIGQKSLYVTVSGSEAKTWLTVNEETAGLGGWFIPFNLSTPFTQIQVIYLEKEMQLKNINLTGVQFIYDSPATMPTTTATATISLAPTTESNFQSYPDDNWNVHFIDADFTTAYEGDFTIQSGVTSSPLIIEFDQPYLYTGGNLIVQYNTDVETQNLLSAADATMPYYHYCDNYGDGDPLKYRTAIFRGMTPDIDVNRIGWNYWTPYTMFSYTTSDGIHGVINPVKGGIDIRQQGNVLVSNMQLEEAELFSVNGTSLLKAANTSAINVGGVHGPCLLRFTVNGQTSTVKIVIK